MTGNWNEILEKQWGEPIVHESGHALMAILTGIPCNGIYFESEGGEGMFCALIGPFSSEIRTQGELLFLAAGAAAEQIIYPDRVSEGDGADRRLFSEQSASSFDETVVAAIAVLTREKRKLRRLISKCKEKIRSVDYDIGAIPSMSMDGSTKTYQPLITREELIEAVRKP